MSDGLTTLERLELVLHRTLDQVSGPPEVRMVLKLLTDELWKENSQHQKESQRTPAAVPLHKERLDVQLNQCCAWLRYLTRGVSGPTADRVIAYLAARDLEMAKNLDKAIDRAAPKGFPFD